MSEWGKTIYGDPCRGCGFDWSISQADAMVLVAGIPQRLVELVTGQDPSVRHPDLSWSLGAYACHVADNLRIYAERFAGRALGAAGPLAPYDQDALARARNYERISIEGALWSLRHAAADWQEAVNLTDPSMTVEHPERGLQTVLDLIKSSAHDACHHAWDIQRSIESAH